MNRGKAVHDESVKNLMVIGLRSSEWLEVKELASLMFDVLDQAQCVMSQMWNMQSKVASDFEHLGIKKRSK